MKLGDGCAPKSVAVGTKNIAKWAASHSLNMTIKSVPYMPPGGSQPRPSMQVISRPATGKVLPRTPSAPELTKEPAEKLWLRKPGYWGLPAGVPSGRAVCKNRGQGVASLHSNNVPSLGGYFELR
eukprot:TRINITY_DN25469_c0_g1_i1.p1 TRINITY_DN25469_c0_g1~~TRINITY_DN25469_c0_g1_i1.p1  ORF type:complete len:125 (+),score=28.85 TRINITY_DN25469_c0_g1_i1:163-537(+)